MKLYLLLLAQIVSVVLSWNALQEVSEVTNHAVSALWAVVFATFSAAVLSTFITIALLWYFLALHLHRRTH